MLPSQRPFLAVGFLLVLVSGCREGCGIAGLVHPGKTEFGGGINVNGPARPPSEPRAREVRFSTGLHVASLVTSRDIPVDVGGGYIRMSRRDASDEWHPIHGAYLEVEPVLLRGDAWRVLVGPRAELLYDGEGKRDSGYGLFGRVSWEAYAPVAFAGGEARGNTCFAAAAYGVVGLSPYAETGAQRLPGGDVASVVLAGLSLRHPAALFCAAVTK